MKVMQSNGNARGKRKREEEGINKLGNCENRNIF